MIGHWEIIVAALVVFVLFGPKALSKISRSLGKAKSEFKKGLEEGEAGDNKNETTEEK